ncbi:Norsolorinic acid ketoreductase [Lachnellula occidentalis]|uniref:Norsolorinic acid ketoreductase n=1 Tax=Lachnellula occidentalis TaxID=215460 RepID=A0A8H8RSL1_9HELO|nr:Norsolorinic acid ketoreductase [Lachnellula occidentalis]
MSSVYLITGANRGLGYAIAAALVQHPQHIVIGAVRSSEKCSILTSLPHHETSSIIPIVLPFGSEDILSSQKNFEEALNALRNSNPDIHHIDVVIANAGISNCHASVVDTPAAAVAEHISVNATFPLILFQTTWPSLKLSSNPRFVLISSIVGSVHEVPNTSAFASVAYGMSKAAANYLLRKLGAENTDLSVIAIHPGWIQTDLGNGRAIAQGLKEAPVKLADSVDGILSEVGSPR